MLLYTFKYCTNKIVLYIFKTHPVNHRAHSCPSMQQQYLKKRMKIEGRVIKINNILRHKFLYCSLNAGPSA